jgi:hypothetical protein
LPLHGGVKVTRLNWFLFLLQIETTVFFFETSTTATKYYHSTWVVVLFFFTKKKEGLTNLQMQPILMDHATSVQIGVCYNHPTFRRQGIAPRPHFHHLTEANFGTDIQVKGKAWES